MLKLLTKRLFFPIPNITLLISLLYYISSLRAHLKNSSVWFYLWGLFNMNFQEVYGYLFCSMPAQEKLQWWNLVSHVFQVFLQPHVDFPTLLKADSSRQLASFCQFSNALHISWHWYCLSFFKLIKKGKNHLDKVFLQLENNIIPLRVITLVNIAFKKCKFLLEEIHQDYMDLSTSKLFPLSQIHIFVFLWIMSGVFDGPLKLLSNASVLSVSMAAQSEFDCP